MSSVKFDNNRRDMIIIKYLKAVMGEKSMFWSANKHSNELHTAVSVAFSVPQCRVKTGRKLLLFIVLQLIQQKGKELRDRPIGN